MFQLISYHSKLKNFYFVQEDMAGRSNDGGNRLVVMVAEKPSICNAIANALCAGAEMSTRGMCAIHMWEVSEYWHWTYICFVTF